MFRKICGKLFASSSKSRNGKCGVLATAAFTSLAAGPLGRRLPDRFGSARLCHLCRAHLGRRGSGVRARAGFGASAHDTDELLDELRGFVPQPRDRDLGLGRVLDRDGDDVFTSVQPGERVRKSQKADARTNQGDGILDRARRRIRRNTGERRDLGFAHRLERRKRRVTRNNQYRDFAVEPDDTQPLGIDGEPHKAQRRAMVGERAHALVFREGKHLERQVGMPVLPSAGPFADGDTRREGDAQRRLICGHDAQATLSQVNTKSPQTLKPATAAQKLGVYLPATPEEFQTTPLTRDQLNELLATPPEWLTELRLHGPHPRPIVAGKLGVSASGLARAGVTEALTTQEIKELLVEPPEWLVRERATQAAVREEQIRVKERNAAREAQRNK
jgi:hypothetical protein